MDYPLYIREEAARRLNYNEGGWLPSDNDEPMQAMCKLLVHTGFKGPIDPLMMAIDALVDAWDKSPLSIPQLRIQGKLHEALAKSLADQGYELVKVAK